MIASEQGELLTGMEAAFTALDRLQKAAESFEVPLHFLHLTFPFSNFALQEK